MRSPLFRAAVEMEAMFVRSRRVPARLGLAAALAALAVAALTLALAVTF